MSNIEQLKPHADGGEQAPGLRLVPNPSASDSSRGNRQEDRWIEMKLSFAELTLIHDSLRAVKTLRLRARQDELLSDTMQLVDVMLNDAFPAPRR